MKKIKGFLLLVLLSSLFFGCKESTVGTNNNVFSFSINACNYSDNYYLLDTVYKNSFIAVMNDTTGIVPNQVLMNKVKYDLPSFQVWVQCDNTIGNKRPAVAYVYLPDTLTANGYRRAAYPRGKVAADTAFFSYFRQLGNSEYYVDPISGFIGLKMNIPENYSIAVAYETYEGKKFGLGLYDIATGDTMVLKLIKCSNQSPDYTPRAWEVKMKNVYRLPVKNTTEALFVLDAYYNNNNVMLLAIPGFHWSLSSMLLLDRYNGTTRRWAPDGKFDYFEGRTIISETGDVIFPTLYPFRDELRKAGLDSNYIFNELFERRKSEAQISLKANMYYLTGYAQGNMY
jgi:hypothetical protein